MLTRYIRIGPTIQFIIVYHANVELSELDQNGMEMSDSDIQSNR